MLLQLKRIFKGLIQSGVYTLTENISAILWKTR